MASMRCRVLRPKRTRLRTHRLLTLLTLPPLAHTPRMMMLSSLRSMTSRMCWFLRDSWNRRRNMSDRSDLYEMGKDIRKIGNLLEKLFEQLTQQGARVMAKLAEIQAASVAIFAAVGTLQTAVTGIQDTIDAEQTEILDKIAALEALIQEGELGPEADALIAQLRTAAENIGAATASLGAAGTD